MPTWTYEISAEHNNYPNLTVYDRFCDGVLNGWRVNANEGYVMYQTDANDAEPDGNGNMVPVTYYYTLSTLPLRYSWANFSWVAVPRSEVDENYMFGGGNNQETM